MNKRQKCSSSISNVNNPSNQILDENPISSNSTNDNKQNLSSTINETTSVNDTVPNWIQSRGQVRLDDKKILIDFILI